ncbi:MAG: DNA primase [Spirochaetes bacterium]|nr:DNA primase [Spirochaetota bacterium]
MGFVSDKTINRIKQSLTIVDVVRDYVKLDKKGRNYTGLCPFHMEKTPSFFVNEEKGVYHCFGCNESGNIFNFVMKIENVSFPESLKLLAKKAGIEIEYQDTQTASLHKEKELIYKINERAMFIYKFYLKEKEEGQAARDELKKREISDEMIDLFNLGYAPVEWDKLFNILVEEKYTVPMIMKSGLIIPSSKGQRYYDRFRNRIIFPIIDATDHVIGFGGRTMEDRENVPKYLNSPETDVFSKRHNLFALNTARNYIRESKQAIVVEGYFDVISLFQGGIKNVVAPLGTSLTEEQVVLLKRYADEIVILFDADRAGNKATIRSISLLLKTTLKIKVVELPIEYDPDSFIRKYGRDSLLKLIEKASSFLGFVVKDALKKYNRKTAEGKTNILNAIFPVLRSLSDEVSKDEVLRFLGQKIKITDSVVRREFQKFIKKGTVDRLNVPADTKLGSLTYAQRALCIIMLEKPEYTPTILNSVELNDFEDELAKTLFQAIVQYYERYQEIIFDEIFNLIENERIKSFVAEELLSSKYTRNLEKQVNDYIYRIKLDKIEKQIDRWKEKINQLKDFDALKTVEARIHNLHLSKEKLLKNKSNLVKLKS